MLDSSEMTEAILQATLLQQQSQHRSSISADVDEMPYDDSVMNLHNTILLQQALHSSPATNAVALDNPSMLAFQDASGQFWTSNALLPTDQMAELHLAHTSTANSSPVIPSDDFMLRRTSTSSVQDVTDWQDKARTEVCILGYRLDLLLTVRSGGKYRIVPLSERTENARRRLSSK
jgi:hypothetical protein